MANPETIIGDIRQHCTTLFHALVEAQAASRDKKDFDKKAGFFTDWFAAASNYDMTLDELEAAVVALDDLEAEIVKCREDLHPARLR